MWLEEFGQFDPSWLPVLAPMAPQLDALASRLRAERESGGQILPNQDSIFRALRTPRDQVRVVIVGQDPYPTPGHALGLAFAVERNVRPVPRSLMNIYRELSDDLGFEPPDHGDLSEWTSQGVLLLNRCLTVQASNAGSHRNIGWEPITAAILRSLAEREMPLVAILWGRDAQLSASELSGVASIASAHPSPLSARRGFFGSIPFSRCNTLLREQDATPVNWKISS